MSVENAQKTTARAAPTQIPQPKPAQPLRPGDDAAPGTPGSGEDICPQCQGNGRINGSPCANCGGTGKIIKAIGGA